ncbi:hypothetical protein EDI_201670 [Entamoeba dispar SAW760]|uniref:Uncharacterized protein n=1 Tax=Entamoeba dispar (strain ATCC PRA-260 / SAW760) TaxID=370354 RepID=B0ETZ4_ENTDS|nr:uncharacterized protein EDI_201670 [Entamoeba dispar SAW760]EDR22051.1 hypothetical protein EDI_201670 [Entamoeba dispar SAW760]|eukprot:EDR22051.1 hypothetical protein EDI_201670 [Entamoeba dispar SAW760]
MLPIPRYPIQPQQPNVSVVQSGYEQHTYSQKEIEELNNENLKLQHEIEMLQEEIKKSKVHPINFTPPIAKLEVNPKIYRFRPFIIKLTINTSFGIQFSGEEVLSAVTKAKIRKENDMFTNITTCWCSSNKEIVEIGVSNTGTIGPYQTDEGFVYILDQCRSHCTSSRDHHHGRLVIVVDQLPGIPPILSNGFELCARVKGEIPEDGIPYSKDQIITPVPNVREKHRVDLQYDSVDLLFTAVFVFASSMTQQQVMETLNEIVLFLKSTEGYISSYSTDSAGLYVLYCYYSTYPLSCSASVQLKAYLSNEQKNYMNQDLHLSGQMRLLAVSL